MDGKWQRLNGSVMEGERGEGFDFREAKRRTDDEEEAALQQDSTQRACNDSLYFSNADFFTQHVGDHWGGQYKTKRR